MSNEEFLREISLEGEKWKDVVGYEGYYMVSNFGRVCSCYRTIQIKNRGYRKIKGVVLKSKPNGKTNHQVIHLNKNGVCEDAYVHRLVAQHFIPNPNNYPLVEHLDCNPINNMVSNLRWTTQTGNMNNPITVARIAKSLKDSVGKKRVQVVSFKNGKPLKIYPSVLATADDSFRPGCVHNCCTGRKQSHQGLQWKFLSDCKDLLSVCQSSLQLPSITHTPHPQLQPLEP